MGFLEIMLAIIIALLTALWLFVRHLYSFWKRRGIPHDKPVLLAGNMRGFLKNRPMRDITKEYYDKYKGTGPFAGFYFCLTPAAFVTDLELAKNVLVKDFYTFPNRGMFNNPEDDPLTAHIFALDNAEWANLRHKLTPTFSSGKMKFMFPTIVSVGEHLRDTVKETIVQDPIVEVKDMLARYAVDVIGTCAFGIECNSLKDPNAEFRKMGGMALTQTRHGPLIQGLMFSLPELARKMHVKYTHEEVHRFFMGVVRATVAYREKNSIKRNDFLNLLIELKQSKDGMTVEQIAAQTFLFFIAGFETTSTTMGFALFLLATHQDIQDKLRTEMNEQLKKHDGQVTYECVNDMHYMKKVLQETLRLYSPVSAIFRRALREYPTSDPKYTIPKGALVIIPPDAIQRDPDIYPDPEKFDPERFEPEEFQKRHRAAWLAFGDGSRNCIGQRFANMQMTVGLTLLLTNFKFHYSDKTPVPLQLDPKNGMTAVKGGIYLRVERI